MIAVGSPKVVLVVTADRDRQAFVTPQKREGRGLSVVFGQDRRRTPFVGRDRCDGAFRRCDERVPAELIGEVLRDQAGLAAFHLYGAQIDHALIGEIFAEREDRRRGGEDRERGQRDEGGQGEARRGALQ